MWVHSLSKRGKNMAFQRVGNMTLKMRRSCQWSQSCFWVEKFCKSGTEGTSKTVQISLVFRMKTFFFSVFSMFSILEASLRCWARYPRGARSTLRSWVHVLSRCLKLLCLRRLRFGYVLSALFARLHLVFRAPAALHRTWLWSRVYTESTESTQFKSIQWFCNALTGSGRGGHGSHGGATDSRSSAAKQRERGPAWIWTWKNIMKLKKKTS